LGKTKAVKRTFVISIGVLWLMLLHSLAHAQTRQAPSLDEVLKKLDATAASFRSLQADFVWDQYQKVVDDHDTQKGTVYYRGTGQNVEMMAEVKDPAQKFVLYKNGKLQVYQPKIDQVMEYSTGGNRSEIENYLVLGFGGSGQDLKQSFDVTSLGEQNVDGIETVELQLLPKSDKLRNNISKILLWLDMNRGISVQQQFFQPQGDYRLAKYSAIKMPAKIGNDVFQLKTNKKTQFISPRG
jgi:outer membrane lipoprotein-sorting protein